MANYFKKLSITVTTSEQNKTINASDFPTIKPVETYLYFPVLGKVEPKNNFSRFFDNLVNLDTYLTDCMVFLNQHSAKQYSSFRQAEHVLLKAFVPHTAIEGRIYGLGLKKGAISKEHIEGLYYGPVHKHRYIKNPYFDNRFQTNTHAGSDE